MSKPVAVSSAARSGPRDLDAIRIEEHGGAAVLTVRGGIDASTASVMRDVLGWAVGCHERVVVDLSQAAHIDRTGLSVLIAAQDGANSRAVQLCFTAPSPLLLTALCELRAAELIAPVDPGTSRPAPDPGRAMTFTLPRPGRSVLAFDVV
jgi:anti-sigma B factor antagonist